MNKSFLSEENNKILDRDHFTNTDPHLKHLASLKYRHIPSFAKSLPVDFPGIYVLTGGCMSGKTTLLKCWISDLLKNEVLAEHILFLAGNEIKNYHQLTEVIVKNLAAHKNIPTFYVFIDDVTDIRDWVKTTKFLEETGQLENVALVISSGEISLATQLGIAMPKQQERIKLNLNLAPLTFREMIALKFPKNEINEINLFSEFNAYLMHGGFLIAINEIAQHGKILDQTLKCYTDWLRKETSRQGKQEYFTVEVLTAILKYYNLPNTWNLLAKEISINHPKTISQYVQMLEELDAVFVQSALIEETLMPAPKKARKLLLNDPFIFHAVRAWITPAENIYEQQIKPAIENIELCSSLVRGCVTTLYRRYFPTYYIKSSGEIDVAYLDNKENGFTPLLISWNNELRPKDLKQLMKYPRGKILTKNMQSSMVEHIRTEPLPRTLWKLKG